MFDEKGNEIDLDTVDAIGELPDGRFEVWLHNERRVITSHPNAFELWKAHIRTRSLASRRTSDRIQSATS